MAFYNILWVLIFAVSGFSLGVLGMADPSAMVLFIVNPRVLNRLIMDMEAVYLTLHGSYPMGGALELQRI